MKNIFYGISICLVLLSSCHLKEMKDKDEIDWSKYPIVELSDPTRISIPVRDFEAEQKLYLVRDSLLFTYATFSQLSELHLYRLQRDTLFWQRLLTQKGQGPLEILQNGRIHELPDGTILLVSPCNKTKIFTLPAKFYQLSSVASLKQWKSDVVPECFGYVSEITPIDSTRYILQTLRENATSLFSLYIKGDTTVTDIIYPCPDREDYSQMSRTMMYSAPVYKRPSEERFCYMASSGRYGYTFQLDGDSMVNIHYLYNKPPRFILEKDGIGFRDAPESEMGQCITVTDRFIYVKFNVFTYSEFCENLDTHGQLAEEKNAGYDCWFNNKIHVFDWEGHPVRTYHLDHHIASMVVDSRDCYLYAITKNVKTDDVSFIKYKLPE